MITGLLTFPAFAQTAQAPVAQLIATKGTLVAGDVTFSNFAQPFNANAVPNTLIPVDGLGNVLASAVINADGTVSLCFTFVDPATGNPAPQSTQFYQSIGYDVTVTNPALLLHSVNQDFGPGTTGGFNFLKYWEPGTAFRASAGLGFQNSLDMLFFDNKVGAVPLFGNNDTLREGVLLDSTCETTFPNPPAAPNVLALGGPNGCASPLPGGNRQSVSLQNFFGATTDNHGIIYIVGPDGSFRYDGIELKFALVPSTAADPVIPVALNDASHMRPGSGNPLVPQLYLTGSGAVAYVPYGFDLGSAPGIGAVNLGLTVGPDGRFHPGFAPAGGTVVTFTTSNPAALPLPASVTMPQGASDTAFAFGDPQIDVPVDLTATVSAGGVTLTRTINVAPTVPLAMQLFFAGLRAFPNVINTQVTLGIELTRTNFNPVVVALTSSNMTVAPVPAMLTIPALTSGAAVTPVVIPNINVPVDTPVTFTATFNGTTYSSSTVIPGITDSVKITKAELVVKNGSLKVDATGNLPSAALKLYNATTGALIGNMTFSGLSGTGAKFSFQGTVPPVTSLRLVSNFNGTSIGTVAQK